jgi:hypothetical protein
MFNPFKSQFLVADDGGGGDSGLSFEQSGDTGDSGYIDLNEILGEESFTPTEPEPQNYTIRVNGQDMEVSQEDLIRYAQQGVDYTKKTQALAEERKANEAAQNLFNFIGNDPNLADFVAKQMWEAQTGTEFSAEAVQSIQLEKKENVMRTADMLMTFRAENPGVDDQSMNDVAQYMLDQGVRNPEIAFKAIMYDRRGVSQRQSRPRLTEGHGAPVQMARKPETMKEASAMALSLLNGDRRQRDSY